MRIKKGKGMCALQNKKGLTIKQRPSHVAEVNPQKKTRKICSECLCGESATARPHVGVVTLISRFLWQRCHSQTQDTG